jgi:6-pyruvoyltetrahydropterin/6-carboxytetrahydropterin synthase
MYKIGVKREFVAWHYLIGGEWGPEGELHSHPYFLELELAGSDLDEHGFVVNIVAVEQALDRVAGTYRDQVLNERPAFAGLNPSIERFSKILWADLAVEIGPQKCAGMVVRLWESESAWCAYSGEADCA